MVKRIAAESGLFLVLTLWLLLLGHKSAGLTTLAVTVFSALMVIGSTRGGTKISVRESTLRYGVSQKINLQGLKDISHARQFGVEDIFDIAR